MLHELESGHCETSSQSLLSPCVMHGHLLQCRHMEVMKADDWQSNFCTLVAHAAPAPWAPWLTALQLALKVGKTLVHSFLVAACTCDL